MRCQGVRPVITTVQLTKKSQLQINTIGIFLFRLVSTDSYRQPTEDKYKNDYPKYDFKILLFDDLRNLRKAFSFIWRTRSRVKPIFSLISSKV